MQRLRAQRGSPMAVVWPSRGADGIYDTVTLSQRKAPYETMPTPDPNPLFAAQLDIFNTSGASPSDGRTLPLRISLIFAISCVLCRSRTSMFR